MELGRRKAEDCQLTYRGYAEPQNSREIQYELYGIEVAIAKLAYRKRQLIQLAADIVPLEDATRMAKANTAKSVDPEEKLVSTMVE